MNPEDMEANSENSLCIYLTRITQCSLERFDKMLLLQIENRML